LTGPSGKFQGFVYARPVRGTGVQEKLSEEERTLRNLEPLEVCSKSIWCFVAQEEVSRAEDRGVQHRYSDDRLFEWRLIPHTLKPFKQILLDAVDFLNVAVDPVPENDVTTAAGFDRSTCIIFREQACAWSARTDPNSSPTEAPSSLS